MLYTVIYSYIQLGIYIQKILYTVKHEKNYRKNIYSYLNPVSTAQVISI